MLGSSPRHPHAMMGLAPLAHMMGLAPLAHMMGLAPLAHMMGLAPLAHMAHLHTVRMLLQHRFALPPEPTSERCHRCWERSSSCRAPPLLLLPSARGTHWPAGCYAEHRLCGATGATYTQALPALDEATTTTPVQPWHTRQRSTRHLLELAWPRCSASNAAHAPATPTLHGTRDNAPAIV